MSGIAMSIRTTCGEVAAAIQIASSPEAAAPTTWISSNDSNSRSSPMRTIVWSSTIMTRINVPSPVRQ